MIAINSINNTAAGGQFRAEQSQAEADIKGFEEALKTASATGDLQELKKVAASFEEVFLNMLFKSMRSTIETSGLFEESNQRDIFEGMLDEEFAKKLAEAGGVGISEMMVTQLQKYVNQVEGVPEIESFDMKG